MQGAQRPSRRGLSRSAPVRAGAWAEDPVGVHAGRRLSGGRRMAPAPGRAPPEPGVRSAQRGAVPQGHQGVRPPAAAVSACSSILTCLLPSRTDAVPKGMKVWASQLPPRSHLAYWMHAIVMGG